MKKKHHDHLKQLKKHGWFENCSYLPSKITEEPIVWISNETEFWQNYHKRRPKTVGGNEIFPIASEECSIDCNVSKAWPAYPCSCDLFHCCPIPMPAIKAKRGALFARKYGKNSYIRQFKTKKYAKLGHARYCKMARSWGWDK